MPVKLWNLNFLSLFSTVYSVTTSNRNNPTLTSPSTEFEPDKLAMQKCYFPPERAGALPRHCTRPPTFPPSSPNVIAEKVLDLSRRRSFTWQFVLC